MKIIFATNNQHKMEEIKKKFVNRKYEVVSLKEVGINIDVEENGATFEENSYIKAKAVYDIIEEKVIVMSDDSGLVVDYINGEPGIMSARYLGDVTQEEKNQSIINRLEGASDRKAQFVCCITTILPNGEHFSKTGTIKGLITEEVNGTGGFGYDPIFYSIEAKNTLANISMEEKNSISHRGRALDMTREALEKLYTE